ncbi:MAG: patatin-like phospholipase family protein [Elusimicrobia bacterium]|nr:patatin-like phospholipase family protein [Elusimicrobiota bacterium]
MFFIFSARIFPADISDYLYLMSRTGWARYRAKVGVVLSGGAARGIAHIGVLKCWKERNLPMDLIVGTSVGAIVGGLFASGLEIPKIEKIGEDLNWNKLVEVKVIPSRLLNLTSIVSNERMTQFFDAYVGDRDFDSLKIPFISVASDLKTGQKIIFREGKLIPAIRASSAIPGIFEPVAYKHRLLVDGGVVDNVPTDVAVSNGMDVVVASWTGGGIGAEEPRSIIAILTRVISISGILLSKKQLDAADVVISPDLKNISPLDIGKFKTAEKKGYEACRGKINEIKKAFVIATLKKIKDEK